MLASLLPTLGGAPKSFTEAFENEFGRRHPAFVEAPTLAQALNAARVAGKFLVVYLPSASPRDEKRHKAFCRTLTDPEVRGDFRELRPCVWCMVCMDAARIGGEGCRICVYVYVSMDTSTATCPLLHGMDSHMT